MSLPRRGLCAALLLSGCAVRLPGTNSGIELPDRFTAAEAAALWPAVDWWKGFGSSELDALMAAAATGSFDIRAAEARLRQADAQVRVTGQALLPTGNLTANTTRSQTSGTTSVSGRTTIRSIDALSLNASYELDFWGRNRAALEAARQSRNASRFNLAVVGLTTQASVANTYLQVLASREQLEIQQQNLAAAERILSLLRIQVNAGTSSGLELAQQQTLVDQQRAQIPPLRQAVAQNTASLGTLTGQVPERIAAPRMKLAELRVPPASPGLPSEVLARRPDIAQAEATLTQYQASAFSARAAMLPAFTLTASGGFQSLLIENLLRPGSAVFSLAAGLTQPIFQLGQLRAQARLTEAQAEEMLENYRKAIVAALVDTENAIVALNETTDQERLQSAATRSAETAQGIAETQFRVGTVPLINVLNTQQTLYSARNQLVQVRLARFQAAVGLFRALGGGWS
ncbi:efflux transporter outer membrane subunit [Rhodovarius crocodyli]|uniref:Efflux transporter outer membrane subunit n=1 Tax=Rhodovarius crocodyli TaxID=1979269 RepID=A0A437MJE6_9PROT|nr:efflux transporter outer membrane subunit [Rhodovarius crocodyli]RVT97753.1 efflux transporter outer membrane subunit [Rhodovarius crocodyli]